MNETETAEKTDAAAAEETAPKIRNADRDALHILPLAMLPFETASLRRARLIKNVRLRSMVELFADEKTGSGQMEVDHIPTQFNWPVRPPHKDHVLLKKLAPLPSYDVYSLRILFREQGIPINDVEDLKLSGDKVKELTSYMKTFTHPLIEQIYGGDDVTIQTFDDVLKLFRDPDIQKVREKLQKMSETLMIDMQDVPRFLEDYGDVFLSLSYYRQCMDKIEPVLDEFLEALTELRGNYQFQQNNHLLETCKLIEATLNSLMAAISGRFETFDRYTGNMWQNLDAARFQQVKRFIENYHTTIGGCLCALTVKMKAWSQRFPHPEAGGPSKRAEFIMSEMKQGIELLEEIEASAPKVETIDWGE